MLFNFIRVCVNILFLWPNLSCVDTALGFNPVVNQKNRINRRKLIYLCYEKELEMISTICVEETVVSCIRPIALARRIARRCWHCK